MGWNDHVSDGFAALGVGESDAARVVRVERTRSIVVTADGAERTVRSSVPPAVGDWVALRGDVVTDVLARRSTLARIDPDGSTVQVLAANVDLVIITAPADRMSPARVERELAVGWASGALPIVTVTKSDIAESGTFEALRDRLAGVEVLSTSARTGAGVAELAIRLRPNLTAVLLGPSGAGKSTLANVLVGDGQLATGSVRESDSRGRHTTTSRQLVMASGGGVIIDSPGLRGLGLVGGSLDRVFPEIAALTAQCHFDDCHHLGEPGCAVRAAIASGELDPDRLESYRKLNGETPVESTRSAPPHSGSRRPPKRQNVRRHEIPPRADDEDEYGSNREE